MAEWQSMETAPKDGSRILVVAQYSGSMFLPPRNELFVPTVIMSTWWKGDKLNRAGWTDGVVFAPHVTHWMPLPDPPQSDAVTSGGAEP